MQKRQEMYDKLLKKIDENITATTNRIEQVEAHSSGSSSTTYGFVTELKSEIILWNDIKKEIKQLKKQHGK